VPLIIPTTVGLDPPAFSTFRGTTNLLGGFFQVQGNAMGVQIIYGEQGFEQLSPLQSLPTGSYSVGQPPRPLKLVGVRVQNAVAGLGGSFSGYFWDTASPVLSYIGTPSTTAVGTVQIPRYSLAQFGALTGLVDQQTVSLVADPANNIAWLLQYNSATGFWYFQGGPPMSAIVDTAESTSSTTYADLATVGPSLTLPRAGDYIVQVGMRRNSASNNIVSEGWMSYQVGATVAVDNDAAVDSETGTNASDGDGISVPRTKTGLAASTVLTGKYKKSGASTLAVTFSQRFITALPVRIQ
jgi:hypothetical protein